MPISNDIFELVKSMNRKERSFFRRYFSMNSAGKEGSMLVLFEKLAECSGKEEKYNEAKLKASLDKKFRKHFPVIKNNLYKLILRSLNQYSRASTMEEKVKRLIEEYDLLFSRSLLRQSENILKKAKLIAEKNEFFMHLQVILDRERVLARYMLDAGSYEKVIEKVYLDQRYNLEKIRNLTDMNDLGNRVTLMLQKYPTAKTRAEQEMKERENIFDNPLLSDESKMLSSVTRTRFYNLNVVLKEWSGDYESSLNFAKKYADEVEKNVLNNRINLHAFIISQYSLLTSSVRARNFDEYEKAYKKLTGIAQRFPNATERDKLEAVYSLGLSVFSASADNYYPERGEAMHRDAEENFRKYERELSMQQKIVWYFVIARFCFARQSYADAGKWLNRLIQLPNVDLSQDYQCYGRIMYLAVAYESGNPDSIEYALRRAYYFLTKRNKVYRYEKIILDYIRQSFRIKTDEGIKEMFVFMHRDLEAIREDPFEENAFDAFNINTWLEWKIK